MADSSPSSPTAASPSEPLGERLARLGRSLGEREGAHRDGLEKARVLAEKLHDEVADALARFHEAAAAAGAAHLRVDLGPVRLDDKHLRAIEFDLERGRHRAIVTVKGRGEVTLVGPFRAGRNEGPCLTFPMDAESELREALGGFLERFLEEAATP